jgi:[ribosomal protein S5]-alanine N-acetyltransferase
MIRFSLARFHVAAGRRIDGKRIYLQAPRAGDWRAWADLREKSRTFLTPWEPTWSSDALSRAAFRRRLRQTALEWHEDSGYGFLIFRREDDAILGGVNLSNIRRGVAQSANLGYWIGEPYVRLGYMTEALRVLMQFVFDRLGLHRIEAACLPHNAASRGLLSKLGFREEGHARQYLRINGSWQDHVLYALLRTDLRNGDGP